MIGAAEKANPCRLARLSLSLFVALLLCVVGGGSALGSETISVVAHVETETFPVAVAVNPATNRIYIAGFSELTVVDGETNTVLAHVATETVPTGVAVNPATNRIYIAGAQQQVNTRWLTVVDGETNAVVAHIETETDPVGGVAVNPTTNRIYIAGLEQVVNTRWLTVLFDRVLEGTVEAPINGDGSSVFNSNRGVVPVKFTITSEGVRICDLVSPTIAVTRTSGGTPGPINEGEYVSPADTGSNYRVTPECQYVYILGVDGLGPGTYRADILQFGREVIGSASFSLR